MFNVKYLIIDTAIAVTLLAGVMAADGCEGSKTPGPRPSVSTDIHVYQQGPECREERWAVSGLCRLLAPLPDCLAEDDAIDGTSGPACYWVDPDNGAIWYNDGNGYILP